MFSKAFGYALRSVVYIHLNSKQGGKVGLEEVAKLLSIPKPFLGKILQDLVRKGLLNSTTGKGGGFWSNQRTGSVTLTEILILTEGSLVIEQCVMGIAHCNPAKPCLLHNGFAQCRRVMVEEFHQKTIDQLANEVELHLSWI